MAQFLRTLCRLPLLVAVLATALALGFGTPQPAGPVVAVAQAGDVSPDGEPPRQALADPSGETPEGDWQAVPDAVLSPAPGLSPPPPARPAMTSADPEFASRLFSPDRPPNPVRLAMRGGRSN